MKEDLKSLIENFSKMDNLERWKFYCCEIKSPDKFIEWSFYSLIASTLQRRVWRGSHIMPIFTNLYTILVGDTGVGKGLIIDRVDTALRHHKLTKEEAKDSPITPDGRRIEMPLLIPVGADASTYEKLVLRLSQSIRPFWHEKDGKKVPYIHSSMSLILEEISSLFRRHTEDLVNFLIKAYNCGDYRYDTISRGEDYIKNCCLNILGGTQPSFIKRIFGDELLTDGFASRAIFICENKNRFIRLSPPNFSPEQVEEYNKILEHLKNLTKLYGRVRFGKEASEFLESWARINKRINENPKLNAYYARKEVTVQKMAMIIHFMNETSLEVNIKECEQALVVLEDAEKTMHVAVTLDNKNPLAQVSENVYKHIVKNGGIAKIDLLIDFWGEYPNGHESLDQVLDYLLKTKKVRSIEGGKYIKYE